MRQDPGEPLRTFAARVQGKAETCEFKTTFNGHCSNCQTAMSGEVYYTEEVIRDILLNGIADLDIRFEALSTEGIQTKPVTDAIAFVETRETACNANPTSAVSELSEYRQSNRDCLIQQKQRVWSRAQSPTAFDNWKLLHVPIVALSSISITRRHLDGTNVPTHPARVVGRRSKPPQSKLVWQGWFPMFMMTPFVRSLPSTSQHHHPNWLLARLQYDPWIIRSSVRDNGKELKPLHTLKSPSILPWTNAHPKS